MSADTKKHVEAGDQLDGWLHFVTIVAYYYVLIVIAVKYLKGCFCCESEMLYLKKKPFSRNRREWCSI